MSSKEENNDLAKWSQINLDEDINTKLSSLLDEDESTTEKRPTSTLPKSKLPNDDGAINEEDGTNSESNDDDEEVENTNSSENDDESEDESTTSEIPVKKESRAQKRIRQLLEQRKQDRLERERELARLQKQYEDRIRTLEEQASESTEAIASTYVETAQARLNAAKDKLRKAKELGDFEAEIEASEELADAKGLHREAVRYKEQVEQEKKANPATNGGNNRSNVDALVEQKFASWAGTNKEFVSLLQQAPEFVPQFKAIVDGINQEGISPFENEFYEEMTKRVNRKLQKEGFNVKVVSPYLASDNEDYDDTDEEQETESASRNVVYEEEAKKTLPKKVNPMSKGGPSLPRKQGSTNRLNDDDMYYSKKFNVPPELVKANRLMYTKTDSRGYMTIPVPTKKK